MAEWLRRQIRTPFDICFPLGAQVQILLVSTFLLDWITCSSSNLCLNAYYTAGQLTFKSQVLARFESEAITCLKTPAMVFPTPQ